MTIGGNNNQVAEDECPSEDHHGFLLSSSDPSQDPASQSSVFCHHPGNVHLERGGITYADT